MKRTYQPKRRKRARAHGFRANLCRRINRLRETDRQEVGRG